MSDSKVTNKAIKKAEDKFGSNVITTKKIEDVGSVSTGSRKIDNILGVGGFPKSRITDLFGNEGSGKSTLTFQSIAEVLSDGGTAVFVDAEHAFTPDYGEQLGIDMDDDNFILVRPDYGEQALNIVDHFLEEADPDIIVVDSVPALVPKEELDGNLEDHKIALQARMMSKALRNFKSKVRKTETALIFINQIRSTMGSGWGSSEKATGGKALKFYSDVRLQVKRGTTITKQDNIIGHELKTQAVKNKVAPPFKETSVHLIYGKGIDNTYDIIERAIEEDIIIKNSSWFYFENEENQIGQGMNSVIKFMNKDNNKEKILNRLNNKDNKNEE